jgi:sugar transport protein
VSERAAKFYSLDKLDTVLDQDTLKRGVQLALHEDNLGPLVDPDQVTEAATASQNHDSHNTDTIHIAGPHENSATNQDTDGITESRGFQGLSNHRISTTSQGDTRNFHENRRLRYLTPIENEALFRERRGSLRSLTKELIVIIAACAIGAIAQGWAQESIVGANVSWPIDLKIATKSQNGTLVFNYFNPGAKPDDPDKGLERFSAVNAITYFAAAVFGAGLSDPLTYVFGRRTALFFAGMCTLGGAIGAAYSQTWIQLFFCRFIQGIGMGAKSSVVPVLESEVLLPELRGKLLVSWQTFVALGIWFGTVANLIFRTNWRHQIGIAFLPAVPLLCLCYVIPEYGNWQLLNGKRLTTLQIPALADQKGPLPRSI